MPRISEMPPPGPLSGLELTAALQGGGPDANIGLPILAYGNLPRGDVIAMRAPMEADMAEIADADPGAGMLRWDNVDPELASTIYISHTDADAADLAAVLATLAVGGFVYVQGGADTYARDNWQKWQVVSVTGDTGYTKVGVTLQASAGEFADADVVELTIQQPSPAPGVDRNVVTAVTSASGTTTIDASLGDYFTTTLTEDTALVVANVPQACTISLRINQDATTARTMTFPASFMKRGGGEFAIPAALGARHRMVATTDDYGATWDVDFGEGYA